MNHEDLNYMKTQLNAASAAQVLELEDVIERVVAQQFVEMALARRTRALSQIRICPRCKGNDVVRHGKDQNHRQRFKCRGCKRTYNILTGTPMARARKPEKWEVYLGYMTQHHTIRAIRQAGIGLNHVTIWRWRHRFLQAAANDNAAVLCGVIEADATIFPHSCKGSRGMPNDTLSEDRAASSPAEAGRKPRLSSQQVLVLTALDRCGGVVQAMLRSLGGIETSLRGRIAAGSVLCAVGRAAYARVADRASADLRVISDRTRDGSVAQGKNGHLGLGRVHAHHRQLRYLVNEQCRGVATRYLKHYLGWHRAMIRPGFLGKTLLGRALS